MISNKFQLLLG